MMWNIDGDDGHQILAWLVLDNPSRDPVLTVVIEGHKRYRIIANHYREDLKAVGWHLTGLCGFVIDTETCPEMTPETYIEFFEEESNLLLFRRAPREARHVRLLHLETQSFPIYEMDRHLAPYIQMGYASAEMIGGEDTLISVCNIGFCQSVMVCGGLYYRRYSSYLRSKEFYRSILLSNPYREIAGRLVRLQMLAFDASEQGSWKGMGQAALVEAFGKADLRNPAALTRAFKGLSDEAFFSLADPTTRKLVATNAEEPMQDHHIGAALDSLAEFEVVGFDDDLDGFVSNAEALLGGATLPRLRMEDPPGFQGVLDAVAACRPVRELVRLDMAVYELAHHAVVKAATVDAASALSLSD